MLIAAQSTISATERALRSLGDSKEDIPLRLPTNLRYLACGAEAALAQLIVTWAQNSKNIALQTFLAKPTQVDDFVRRLPGLIAALCANSAIGTTNDPTLFKQLRSAALSRLKKLQSPDAKAAFRGSSAEIICADHLDRSAPYFFYFPDSNGSARLRSREHFRDLANWLLRVSIPIEYQRLTDKNAAEAIGAMLFEVFKNTEDHALVDTDGNRLKISIRGIKTNHHAVPLENLARIVGDFSPLANYCKTLTAHRGAVQTHLFEISVLDSGPGFAATWTRRPVQSLSRDEEESAVQQCFHRGSVKQHSHFGEGLPLVLRLLRRQAGFLRLRTGRLSFFADFSRQSKAAEIGELSRYDPEGSPTFAPVSGSLLTLLIPMRR